MVCRLTVEPTEQSPNLNYAARIKLSRGQLCHIATVMRMEAR